MKEKILCISYLVADIRMKKRPVRVFFIRKVHTSVSPKRLSHGYRADDRAQDIRWMSVMRGPERSGDIEPRFNVSIRMKKRPVRVFFYADDRT